ncbi:unnamed protein product, partial [Rotaria sordida]
FTPPGGSSSFYGNELLDVQLQDGDWLKIYKLSESSGSTLNDNEVRRKALPFVYDTRRYYHSFKSNHLVKTQQLNQI